MALALNPRTRVGHALSSGSGSSAAVTAAWDSGAFFGGESFGEVDVEWPADALPSNASAGGGATLHTPSRGGRITLRAVDTAGTVRFEHTVPFDFLAPWPAAIHPSNGLPKASRGDLEACAKAGLGDGLTPPCAAVLASCDGHRGVDLGDVSHRSHSAAIVVFKAVMTVAAVVALVGAPVALAWLLFVLGSGAPLAALGAAEQTRGGVSTLSSSHAAGSGRRTARSALVVAVAFLLYTALWWEHAVMPFEA